MLQKQTSFIKSPKPKKILREGEEEKGEEARNYSSNHKEIISVQECIRNPQRNLYIPISGLRNIANRESPAYAENNEAVN